LVVAGDADFASDAYLDLLGNRDLALNAVAWVAGEEAVAGERPKQVPEVVRPLSPLVLTAGDARAIFVAGAIVEPGLVLLAGVTLVGPRPPPGGGVGPPAPPPRRGRAPPPAPAHPAVL